MSTRRPKKIVFRVRITVEKHGNSWKFMEIHGNSSVGKVIQASLRALRHLLYKGKSEDEVVNVMLPVDYHAFAEVPRVELANRPLIRKP